MKFDIIDEKIYDEFVALCANSETFYFMDQELEGTKFRIFGYRICSHSDWLVHPLARWLRGLMFQVDENAKFVRVASRPFKKFYNAGESFNADLKFEDGNEYRAENKMDGSLISSFRYNSERCATLGLKSKMSLHSPQAVDSMKLLCSDEYRELYAAVDFLTHDGYTIDFEYCAPTNRIVLSYPKPQLTVLSMRKNHNGEEYTFRSELAEWWVPAQSVTKSFIDCIPDMKDDIEGFVIFHSSGERIKIKTEAYLTKHAAKDGIGNPKKVIAAILTETIDDVKSLFSDDKILLSQIEKMEELAKTVHNHLVASQDAFWNENRSLTRKDYAIKAKSLLGDRMSLAMNLFLGKPTNYAEYIMKHFEDFFPDVSWYVVDGTS